MFKKMIYVSLTLLMSNVVAMYKYCPTIEVVVGKTKIVRQETGDASDPVAYYPEWESLQHTVRPNSTVLDLKKVLVQRELLGNTSLPLYANLGTNPDVVWQVREIMDNESLENIVPTAPCLSIYSEIYKQ